MSGLGGARVCAVEAGDTWLQGLLQQARSFLLDALGPSTIQGLILTGSLARGEASVLTEGRECRLLGDVEFLVVVRSRRRWRRLRRQLHELSLRVTQRLGSAGGDGTVPVLYSPVDSTYLRERARPSIFTFDLRRHGRVLYGPPDLPLQIPHFERSALGGEDSLELLMNRGIELLSIEGLSSSAELKSYSLVKTLLDLAGSLLACAGEYESTYARRPAALASLFSRRGDLRKVVTDHGRFLALVEDAANLKLAPTACGLRMLAGSLDARALLSWTAELWRWEASCLLGEDRSDLPLLVTGYLANEGWQRRLRGWAKYLWHPLRPSSAGLRPETMRLITRASPRRLVYGSAVLAIDGSPGWRRAAAELLPTVPHSSAEVLGEIVDSWKWLIQNN
jgi:hypothetical protein